jgi:hypothetical protein
MISFQTIKESIFNINYGFGEPKSLIIFVPIVSLIVQKIQISDLIDTLKNTYKTPYQFVDLKKSFDYGKLKTIYKWHALGSLIQTISLLFLLTFNPLFLIPAAFSIHEFYRSFNGIVHEVIHMEDGKRLIIEK